MAMWLRQSTASQEIQLGKFVDDTDGKTAETALTIANTDIKLWKEGATTQASKNSGGATHIANGWYYAVLDATDTNTLGKLEVTVDVSGALSVKREFMVVPAMVYDSLVLGTDTLQADVTQWLGTTVPTPGAAGYPLVDVRLAAGETVQTDSAGSFNVNVTLWAGATTVVDNLTTIYDTDWMYVYNGTTKGYNVNVTHYQGTGVFSTNAGYPDVYTTAVSSTATDSITASVLAQFSDDAGTAQAGASTTITLRSGAVATDDYYNGAVVNIYSGTGAGQSRRITDYVGSTKVATVDSAWATNPDSTSLYFVIGRIV